MQTNSRFSFRGGTESGTGDEVRYVEGLCYHRYFYPT